MTAQLSRDGRREEDRLHEVTEMAAIASPTCSRPFVSIPCLGEVTFASSADRTGTGRPKPFGKERSFQPALLCLQQYEMGRWAVSLSPHQTPPTARPSSAGGDRRIPISTRKQISKARLPAYRKCHGTCVKLPGRHLPVRAAGPPPNIGGGVCPLHT